MLPLSLALLFLAAAPPRTILAVGAHCGDMEISAGAVLARQARAGDQIVLLHLTAGERGNPKMSPAAYGEQKRREALAAAKVLGGRAIFGPYRDGELPNDEAARRYVAQVIREVKPSVVITHWRRSMHRDHEAAYAIVNDAVLLAALEGVEIKGAPHRGVRVYYAENWEDADDFKPYVYIAVPDDLARWKECATQYEFIRGGISSFPYLEYYEALAKVRGAESGKRAAVAFDIESWGKKRILDALP
ncbi:MAG TPA: PIG-L family deacetylase [Bryobacteraceae bacterium]|nr:PIG-L family deacetylase [Bryobacteraceae bacterium]